MSIQKSDVPGVGGLMARFEREPLAQSMKATLVFVGDGTALVSAPVREYMCTAEGPVQGGMTATLANYAGVYAAMSRTDGQFTPCAQIIIDLLHPVLRGDHIHARAQVAMETPRWLWVDVIVSASRTGEDDAVDVATARIRYAKPRVT